MRIHYALMISKEKGFLEILIKKMKFYLQV
jgi:hypothetical protein